MGFISFGLMEIFMLFKLLVPEESFIMITAQVSASSMIANEISRTNVPFFDVITDLTNYNQDFYGRFTHSHPL